MTISRFLASTAIAYALLQGVAAHAQVATGQAQQASPADAQGEGEIVVTAQRRSENAQSIPLAVTAIGGDLQSKGITSVSDLTGLAPSTQILTNTGAINVSIRGITTNSISIVADTAVAYGFNGVPILHPVALPISLYDLERIEVLRGPQGTLYGRSATGGAVNFIAKRPEFKLGAAGTLTLGNYGLFDLGAVANIPLGDTAALRGVVQRVRHDGYLRTGTNDQDDVSARVGFLFNPTDRLSIYLSGDYNRRRGKGSRSTSCPPGSSAATDPIPGTITDYCENFAWDPYDGGPTDQHSDLNYIDYKIWGISGEVSYDFGSAALTYIPSYRVVKGQNYTLGTSTYRSAFAGGDYVHVGRNIFDDQNKLQSHELRLASDGSGPLTWVVGGIYLNDWIQNYQDSVSNLPISGPLPVTGIRAYSQERKFLETKSYAAFTQATYSITDAVRLTAGARYTKDDKTSRGTTNVLNANGSVTVVPGDGHLKYNNVTYRLGIDANVAPRSLVYATVSSGYKAGGFNAGIQPNLFKPERVTDFEIGTKNEFFDRALKLNLTGFYYNYRDYQYSFFGAIQVPNPAGGTLTIQQPITASASKVRIKGIELESSLRATPTTTLSFNATYLDAKFVDFRFGAGNYSGNRLPYSPKWILTGTLEQNVSLGSVGDLHLRFNTLYNSDQSASYFAAPGAFMKEFTRSDASVSFSPRSSIFRVTAWVRNIENKAQITAIVQQSAYNPTQALVTPPRTFGLTLDAKY